jgi:CRP/FNR family transcriptional regulator, dissimilatory nitrate respiration regulator
MISAAQYGQLNPKEIELLRRSTLFRGFSDAALAAMMSGCTPRTAHRGTTLFLQGEPADRFYLVFEGWIKLFRTTAAGAVSVIHVVAPGETFAEAALFGSALYPVTAEAATDCRLLAITRRAFTRTLENEPSAVMATLASLSLRLRSQVQEIEQRQVQSTAQRVGAFLLRLCPPGEDHATFDLPFEKGLLARRLGMKPETFSRALSKLKGTGVHTAGPTVSVTNIDQLRLFCGQGRDEEA